MALLPWKKRSEDIASDTDQPILMPWQNTAQEGHATENDSEQRSAFVTEPKHLTAPGLIRDMKRVDSCRPHIGLV